MTDATLIADLVRAGVTADLVGRVANALLNVRDNVRDNAVKEHERARKRKWRETAAAVGNHGGAQANDGARAGINSVPQNVPDIGVNHCDLSSTSSSVKGLTEEGSKEKKKEAVTKCARGTRLTAGVQISHEDFQFALDHGMPRERIAAEWAEFIDYWIAIPGQRGTKLNWSATWRNRVRAITAKGGRNGQRPRAHHSGESAVLAGLARAFGDRDGGSSGPADTEIPRGRFEFDAEPTRRS